MALSTKVVQLQFELFVQTSKKRTDFCTEFNPDETLTILGCIFVRFQPRISKLLLEAKTCNQRASSSIYNSGNAKASKISGNPFEVSSAAGVVDATHHDKKNFCGQPGLTFVKNLILNKILGSELVLNTMKMHLNIGKYGPFDEFVGATKTTLTNTPNSD